MTLLEEACAAAQTVAMDISAAADIFERIGRLNLIALRARKFSYDQSSLSCHVGRSADIRLVISAETGGYRIDAYRLSERTLHIRHLVHAVSGAGDLTDSLFDALDSLL